MVQEVHVLHGKVYLLIHQNFMYIFQMVENIWYGYRLIHTKMGK